MCRTDCLRGLILALSLCTATIASSQTPQDVERALVEGPPGQALSLFDRISADAWQDPARQLFLEGLSALDAGETARAIRAFEALVTAQPHLGRPRLELARAYFLHGDDANAKRQFTMLRSAVDDPNIRAMIDAFLEEIDARKRYSFRLSGGIVPDSNANQGASDATINIPGFEGGATLNSANTAQTGLGVEINIGADLHTPPDDAQGRWLAGADLYSLRYEDSNLSSESLTVRGGRVQRWGAHELSFMMRQARYFQEDTVLQTDRLALFGLARRLGFGHMRAEIGIGDRQFDPRQGALALRSFSTSFTGPLSQTRWIGLSYSLEDASGAIRASAVTHQSFGASVSQEFSNGLVIALRPQLSNSYYHDPAGSLFAVTRRIDWLYSLHLDLKLRRFRTLGLTPYANITLDQRESVSDVFEYQRARFRLGVTQQF